MGFPQHFHKFRPKSIRVGSTSRKLSRFKRVEKGAEVMADIDKIHLPYSEQMFSRSVAFFFGKWDMSFQISANTSSTTGSIRSVVGTKPSHQVSRPRIIASRASIRWWSEFILIASYFLWFHSTMKCIDASMCVCDCVCEYAEPKSNLRPSRGAPWCAGCSVSNQNEAWGWSKLFINCSRRMMWCSEWIGTSLN